MKLSARQQECLQKMGVTLYKTIPSKLDYWVGLENVTTPDEEALLTKMIAAMHWPYTECKIYITLESMLEQTQAPLKGLVFSDESNATIQALLKTYPNILQLPSLKTLLNDLNAKKIAWKKMQVFMKR